MKTRLMPLLAVAAALLAGALPVGDARNVRVAGNHIKAPGAHARPAVHVGTSVLRLTQDFGASSRRGR